MDFKTLDDFSEAGKRVIVRVDFNMPFDDQGTIANTQRIDLTMPTFKELLDKGCKIVVMTHFKRPKGKVVEELRVDKIASKFSEIIGREVKKLDSCVGKEVENAIANQGDEIIFLENIQFDPGELENSDEFGKTLAAYADAYVLDAFGQAHRNYGSLVAIQKFLPSYAGRLVEREVRKLSLVTEDPKLPVVCIVGGAKEDKIEFIKTLLARDFDIIIGGMLANTFLKAKGVDVKGSRYDAESVELAKDILASEGDRILLPIDCIAASDFAEDADSKACGFTEIPDGWMILDIGPKTIEAYKEKLGTAKTVFWGGPIGVFEWEAFGTGTKEISRFLAESDILSIIGGGESATAVTSFGFADKMTHVSSGGGASMKFLSGKPLPALVALQESAA